MTHEFGPTVLHAIRGVAESLPFSTAVVQGVREYTYEELWSRAGDFSCEIQRRGAAQVVVRLDKSFEAYASLLGCLMAGALYIPIPPGTTEQRVAAARLLKPDLEIVGEAASPQVGRQAVSADQVLSSGCSFVADMHDANLAYVMFTSGSTGPPKVVSIERGSLSWFLFHATLLVTASPADVWAQQSGLGFDLSLFEVLGCFMTGGTLAVPDTPLDVIFPGRWVRDAGASILQSVPSVVRSMIGSGDVQKGCLRGLRVVSFCGEPLLMQVCRTVWENSSASIFNTYGPTESTVFCFGAKVDKDLNFTTAPIGEAFPGVTWRIEGSGGGELILSGPGVRRPYLSAEGPGLSNFVRTSDNVLEYRTGDVVSLREGRMFFEGRVDSQVKVMGVRVELAEVEHWLSFLGFPVSCAVALDDHIEVMVESTVEDVDLRHLVDELSSYLPVQALPRRIVTVRQLPRNVNAKVDRIAVTHLLRSAHE